MPEAPDCDVELIKKGVSSITSISDTLYWWHGTWVGQVPFWRPLTSYVFYLESRLIGFDNWSMMMTVSFILHLIFVGCFFWFATYLSNKWLASAAVSWFAAWRWPLAKLSLTYWLCIVPAKSTALRAWKDQPEILVGIFIILACVFAMRKKWLLAIFASVSLYASKKADG